MAAAVSMPLLSDPELRSYVPARLEYGLRLVLGLPIAMILGSVLAGLVQWLCLRRQARRPGLFVIGSAVGWGAATFVAGLTFTWTLSSGMGPALTMWGMVCGVVYGAITASMLTVLLPNPTEPGPRSLLVTGGAVTLVAALMAVHILGTSMTEDKLVRQYQDGKRDFSGISLRQPSLPSANLRGIVLRRADLRGANLKGADLSQAVLIVADLSHADLSKADLTGSDLRGASLRGANLSDASMHGANLGPIVDPDNPCPDGKTAYLVAPGKLGISGPRQKAYPRADDLSWARLRGASPQAMGLSGANLSAVYLFWMGLPKVSTVASHPSLFEPVECRTDLSDADLQGADLSHASLRNAILSRANLEGANLEGADLTWADLRGAMVTDEQLAQAESLKRATLPDGSVHQ
jgi:uncharacterized protein YjbI with pentapeptide repeats